MLFLMQPSANTAVPDSLFYKANKFYMEGSYDDAIALYQQIIDAGYVAPEVYYNLGNAFFKTNNIPYSILNYERAKLFEPGNEDINFNLEKAKTYVVDKIDIVPEFIVKKWVKNLFNITSSNTWAIISGSTFLLFFIFLLFYLFSQKTGFRKVSFWTGIVCILISVISLSMSFERKKYIENNKGAIIISPTVTAKSSPNEIGTNLFILHEGARVNITDSINGWNEIKLSDGNKGWIPVSDLEKI